MKYKLTDQDIVNIDFAEQIEYRSAWLQAEREFAINCFSIIGCFPASQNINPLTELDVVHPDMISSKRSKDIRKNICDFIEL